VHCRSWLILPLFLAVTAGCGSSHRASASGLRIYDPTGRAGAEVTATDVIRSSVRTGPESRGTAYLYFALTRRGRQRFRSLTRALARRGTRLDHFQHFAFAVSGRIYGRPFIDYRAFPDGLDGQPGIELPGIRPKVAKRVAAQLREGASR
jgi:hypothetical protein